MSASFTERLKQEHAEALPALPAAAVSGARRAAALQRAVDAGLPSLRDDAWRYADLRPLARARLAPTGATDRGDPWDSLLPEVLTDIPRFVFLNGRFDAARSAVPAALAGGALRTVAAGDAATDSSGLAGATADERFAWLNDAFAVDVARLDVSGSLEVELLFVSLPQADAGASYPRLEVTVAPGARLRLIERHLGGAGPTALVNAAVRMDIGRDASVEHLRLQTCAADALFIDSLLAELGAGAQYLLSQLNLGAGAARNSLRVTLSGEAAGFDLKGISVAGAQRVLDTSIRVTHTARRTTSVQLLRAIANERSGVGFSSHVDVTATAGGADSRQSLKGLLGGAGAEVNLRPQLEIFTDEVKASHGATTGALDQAMLFYLLSRGLDPDVARRLLEWAFLEDVLAHIPLPALRRQIELATLAQLGNTLAREALL